MLANLKDFKGNTHEKEISFSIRDRVAPMKTYGFLYTNSNNELIITDAGKMIIDDKRPKEIFLKQMLMISSVISKVELKMKAPFFLKSLLEI